MHLHPGAPSDGAPAERYTPRRAPAAPPQVRWMYREVDPDEYDDTARRRPACCPLRALGDARDGRRLLADFPADDAWTLAALARTPAGARYLASLAASLAAVAGWFAAAGSARPTGPPPPPPWAFDEAAAADHRGPAPATAEAGPPCAHPLAAASATAAFAAAASGGRPGSADDPWMTRMSPGPGPDSCHALEGFAEPARRPARGRGGVGGLPVPAIGEIDHTGQAPRAGAWGCIGPARDSWEGAVLRAHGPSCNVVGGEGRDEAALAAAAVEGWAEGEQFGALLRGLDGCGGAGGDGGGGECWGNVNESGDGCDDFSGGSCFGGDGYYAEEGNGGDWYESGGGGKAYSAAMTGWEGELGPGADSAEAWPGSPASAAAADPVGLRWLE
jgi:hypothetical protein